MKQTISIGLGILVVIIVAITIRAFVLNKDKPISSDQVVETNYPLQPQSKTLSTSEPVVIADETSDWKIYQNEEYGFEFGYPKDWPAPQFHAGNLPSDGGYPDEASFWKLYIGPKIQGACEGEDCYEMYFDGYKTKNILDVKKALQGDDLVKIISENEIPKGTVLVYEEGGICGFKHAFILGKTQTVKLTSHCGADDAVLSKLFDQVLATFKLTK